MHGEDVEGRRRPLNWTVHLLFVEVVDDVSGVVRRKPEEEDEEEEEAITAFLRHGVSLMQLSDLLAGRGRA